jgi:hypothetical protein
MTSPTTYEAPGRRLIRLGAGLLALLLIGVGGLFALKGYHGTSAEKARPPALADEDPRLTIATPYGNVRPDVKYVGDEACAGCHAEIARTYRQHPMGRSMVPMAQLGGREDYTPATHNPFEHFGFDFMVEQRGKRVVHALRRKANDGAEVLRQERDVAYVVGSGTRGRAYLVEHEGRLVQSPINWFSQKHCWDLAPNETSGPQSDYFAPISAQCVFCHANYADPIDTTVNGFRAPVFARGCAIGCERCHGPGELHVGRQAKPVNSVSPDETIVNPRRLESPLRESVCQQCHLQGEVRVERRGRRTFDFRPGLPLERFWSVFVRAGENVDQQFVGQVEQMYDSVCFRASSAALGCISCHDPHRLPEPAERVAYYRQRCLGCHMQKGCPLPTAQRQAKNGDDCIACHMPRINPSDVAHTAMTDHRIPRRPGRPARPTSPARPALVAGLALASFFGLPTEPPERELLRDLGVALVEAPAPRQDLRHLRTAALSLLEASPEAAPLDPRARLARSQALWTLGWRAQALAGLEALLQEAPEHEAALRDAAQLAEAVGRPQAALDYWRRVLAVNPRSAEYHANLAKLHAGLRHWPETVVECRTALGLNPTLLQARMLLVQGLMESGDRAAARAEVQTLLALDPPQKAQLERVLAELQR